MKQCCNDDCINAKGCEQKAKERWSKQPSLFAMVITNPMVIFGVGFFLGFVFGII